MKRIKEVHIYDKGFIESQLTGKPCQCEACIKERTEVGLCEKR